METFCILANHLSAGEALEMISDEKVLRLRLSLMSC